jgi:hypothetical protein
VSDVPDKDTTGHCTKTYYPMDPTGQYGWLNRVITGWFAEFRIASTFDGAAPHSYATTTTGSETFVTDSFTGPAGSLLQNHTGEQGATWSKAPGYTADAQLTSDGRLRPSVADSVASYAASGMPATADYTVQADLVVKSNAVNDSVGVDSRLDTTSGNRYFCRYRIASSSSAEVALMKRVNGTLAYVASTAAIPLTAGTYPIKLTDRGSSHTCTIGSQTVTASDASITGIGHGGVRVFRDGRNGSPSDGSGLLLDNFVVK